MATETPLFVGERVRLAATNPEKDAAAMATWSRDAEFLRLLDSDPARGWSAAKLKNDLEEAQGKEEPKAGIFPFLIRALDGDRLLGFVSLDIDWPHRDAWVAIALGERADWSKGYGSDAMRVLLRFAFRELNLQRVSLSVFGYNPRAQRSYAKVGFVVEGVMRERLKRDGRRWDMLMLGILREDWEKVSA
jgi:RimJ/RimL family protein N-acetyltransferase